MCSKRSWHVKAVLGSKRRATLLDATSSGACTIAALTENPTMRIVLAPDSFKWSLTAREVCDALSRGLARAMPDVEIVARPMADGGEGTLDAVLAAVGERGARHHEEVTGAGGDRVRAAYGVIDGTTAVIEVAQVVGITDRDGMRTHVEERTTRGIGELIARLVDRGIRRFMIGLGGSSTNDGGSGLLHALGVRLHDAAGRDLAPTPRGLASIAHVEARDIAARLRGVEISIMSDVDNPLCGRMGATAIFGPQKGVPPADVERIDDVLRRFARASQIALASEVMDKPGSGAAGGLGFALQLVGGTMRSGAEVVADLVRLDDALASAGWAVTGEGRSDRQTLLSKAPFVVARHASALGVPVTLLSGAVDDGALPDLHEHFRGCFALPARPMTLDECMRDAATLLAARAESLGHVIAAAVK
jgi:glycerate kinase